MQIPRPQSYRAGFNPSRARPKNLHINKGRCDSVAATTL